MSLSRIFQDEINASEALKAHERKEAEKQRQKAFAEHIRALNVAPEPTKIPSTLKTIEPADRKFHQIADERRSRFVGEVEDAWLASRGRAPVDFLATLPRADLEFFTDPQFRDEVPEAVWRSGMAARAARLEQEAEFELAQYIYDNDLHLDQAGNVMMDAIRFIVDPVGGAVRGGLDLLFGNDDEIPDGLVEMYPGEKFSVEALNIARTLRRGEGQLDEEGWGEILQNLEFAVTGGTQGGRETAESFLQFIGLGLKGPLDALMAIQYLPFDGDKAFATFFGPQAAAASLGYEIPVVTQEQRDALTVARDDEEANRQRAELLRAGFLPSQAWQYLEDEDPQAIQEYVEMYGSYDLARMGFFIEFEDLAEHSGIDVEQQTEDLIDAQFDQFEKLLDSVDEQNFKGETVIMDILTTWNDIVDSIGATLLEATGGVLTNQEARNLIKEGKVVEFFEDVAVEVEKGGHTPAGVLGIEGSFLGLLANMGLGMILDPTNWFIGPGWKAGAGLASRAAIKVVMKSPAMRLFTRGLGNAVRNGGKGVAAWLSGLADTGKVGDVLAAVGMGDNVLQSRLWLSHPTGRHAAPATTDNVVNLLDDVQVQQMADIDPAKIEQAKNTLRNADSFDRPIVLEFDEATGRVIVPLEGDELAPIAAYQQLVEEAAQAGTTVTSKIPVVIRRTNSSTPPPAARAWTGNAANEIEARPGEFVYHGRPAGGTARTEMNQGGFSSDINRAEAYATTVTVKTKDGDVIFNIDDIGGPGVVREGQTVEELLLDAANQYKRTTGLKGDVVVSKPEVVAVRKSDLPQAARDRLEAGLDIEQLSDFGDVAVPVAGRLTEQVASAGRKPVGPRLDQLGQDPPKKVDWNEIDGDEYASPQQFFNDEYLGRVTDLDALRFHVEDHLARGGTVPGATMGWGAIGLGRIFRSLGRAPGGRTLDRLLRTSFNVDRLPMQGGLRRGIELIQFLTPDDAFGAHWTQRLLRNEEALGKATTQIGQANRRLQTLWELDRRLANRAMHESPEAVAREALVEEAADLGIDDVVITKMQTIDEIRFQLRQQIRREQDKLAADATAAHGAVPWQQLYDEMLEDFNRNHIATNPEWKAHVNDEGLVPWEDIHRGFDPEELGYTVPSPGAGRQKRLAQTVEERYAYFEELGEMRGPIPPNRLQEVFTRNMGLVEEVRLPATPIELAAAAQMGGAKYTQWTQEAWKASMLYGAKLMDQLWKANVLVSPRTMMVMSVDELTSMMHAGGLSFVGRYLQARSDKIMARIRSVDEGRSVLNSRAGRRELSAETKRRMQLNDSIPAEFRSYSNALAEETTRETVLLEPGSLGYDDAARQVTRGVVENPAMRAYFQGEEVFREWFDSVQGQEWQLSQVVRYIDEAGNVQYRMVLGWEEAYQMADDAWRLRETIAVAEGLPRELLGDFRQEFADTAQRVTVERTGTPITPSEWVFDYLGPLEGAKPVYPGGSMLWPTVGRAFKAGAADPAEFRQGLAAEFTRVQETQRLRNLFESQGLEVVSDADLLDILAAQGLDTRVANQFNSPHIDQYLFDRGIVTEGYIARLAEHRARDMVNDMTYMFEQGSRLGRQASAVFPFGRAWGDMFGRWGRLIGQRAVVRPWMRRAGLDKIGQKVLDHLPFNPRTLGFLSRVAGRGLEITGGLVGNGETDLDLSPMTFLPNVSGGLSNLVPGIGLLPQWALDQYITHFGPDPVEDPIGYQQMIDAISTFIPGMALHGRGLASRFFGGGFTGVALGTSVEAIRATLTDPNRGISQFTGNLSAELTASRAVSAAMADPDVMADLLAAETPDQAFQIIMAQLGHASKSAAGLNFLDNILGWIIPARGAFDTNLDEVYKPWVDAAALHPDLFPGLDLPTEKELLGDPELLLRTGDDIRRRFFALPSHQRDLLVATSPTLAVNLIPKWEWSEAAPDYLPGRDMPYRTVGSARDDASLQSALARHENYVRHGWVQLRDYNTKPHEIIGTVMDARRSVAQYIYEEAAKATNDFIWEDVLDPQRRETLEVLAQRPEFQKIGIRDGRHLWEEWATHRETVEESIYAEFGAEPGESEAIDDTVDEILDELRPLEIEGLQDVKGLNAEAWSTSWNGDDIENYSARRLIAPVTINEELLAMADALDLDLMDGMNGETFLAELMTYRSQTRNGAWNEARLHYTKFRDERGLAYTAGIEALSELTNNRMLDEEYRNEVDDFISWVDNQTETYDELGGAPRSVQDEVVDRFNRLATAGHGAPVDWDRIWHRAFQPRFGPREWEPPTPAPITLADGNQNPNAWTPFIEWVVDGDTIIVSENRGPSMLNIDVFPRLDAGPQTGLARGHAVRLLGVYAADRWLDEDAYKQDRQALEDALTEARRNGDTIWLVRDPSFAGSHTDPFGRELAWLYIGDEPYYDPEALRRGQ